MKWKSSVFWTGLLVLSFILVQVASADDIKQTWINNPEEGGLRDSRHNDSFEVICTERWNCTPWGDCISGMQGRNCTFEAVEPFKQYACQDAERPPANNQECDYSGIVETPAVSSEVSEKLTLQDESLWEEVAQEPEQKKPYLAYVLAALAVVVIAIILFFAVKKKKHKKASAKKLETQTAPDPHEQKVRQFIESMRLAGKNDFEISEKLISVGWNEHYVDSILNKMKK